MHHKPVNAPLFILPAQLSPAAGSWGTRVHQENDRCRTRGAASQHRRPKTPELLLRNETYDNVRLDKVIEVRVERGGLKAPNPAGLVTSDWLNAQAPESLHHQPIASKRIQVAQSTRQAQRPEQLSRLHVNVNVQVLAC